MIHLHMTCAVLIILLFLYQSYVVLTDKNNLKPIKVLYHICFAFMIITGIMLVMPLLDLPVSLHWVVAKAILLCAVVSASIKAFKDTATPSQQKAGMFLSVVGFTGIIILAVVKPDNFI